MYTPQTKLMNDLKANELAVLKKLANRDEPNAGMLDSIKAQQYYNT